MSDLHARLAANDVVLIDGATGTELELLDVGTVENAWCALASMTDPEAVVDVHRRHIEAGAELIIANTFVCSRHVLERAGHGQHFEMLNTRGVELALEARDAAAAADPAAADVVVAASISTTAQGLEQPPIDDAEQNFVDQVKLLAGAGAELLILEMMRDIDMTRIILRETKHTALPTWVGFSCDPVEDEPTLIYDGPSLAEAIDSLDRDSVDAVLIMHTEVDDIDPCIEVALQRWDGPLGVYAHTGGWVQPNWVFENMINAKDYTDAALRWVDAGVQIIGGCCGITPDHIAHMRDRLPSTAGSR